MQYIDYQKNIVDQLNAATDLGLVWEDFTLTNQRTVQGATIEVTIQPTPQGEEIFKGATTLLIKRMDLTNTQLVYVWKLGSKVMGSVLAFNDKSLDNQHALFDLLNSVLGIPLDLDNFEAVDVKTSLFEDTTLTLVARPDSFYYYGTMTILFTRPWLNQAVFTAVPPAPITITATSVGNAKVWVDGAAVELPYSLGAGSHDIVVRGFQSTSPGFSFLNPTELKNLQLHNSVGTGLFRNAKQLTSIAEHCILTLGSATVIDSLFEGCTALTTLPSHLFQADSEAANINSLFQQTGITSIPETLWDGFTFTGTALNAVFAYTSNLTSITAAVLAKLGPSVITTNGLFQYSGLVTIPRGLFDKFPNLQQLNNTFSNCDKLTSIPTGFFTSGATITQLSGTFRYCVALASIPTDFLTKLVNLTNCDYVWGNCTALKTLPPLLFNTNTKIATLIGTFANCGITNIPTGLLVNQRALVYASTTFSGCVGLVGIPDTLFLNCTGLVYAVGTFSGCSGLTAIPPTLFSTNLLLARISECFRGVINPFTIPANFFPGSALVGITGVFQDSGITSIGSGTFVNHTGIAQLSNAFNNSKLVVVPANLFKTVNGSVVAADGVFANCLALTTVESGAIVITTVGTGQGGSCTSWFSGCAALTTVGTNGISIIGRISSLASFLSNCGTLKLSVAELLSRIKIVYTNPADVSIDFTGFCYKVIWLTGTVYDLWLGLTGFTTATPQRINVNLVEECFLLTDYESSGSPWWTTSIRLARSDSGYLPIYNIEPVEVDIARYGCIPRYATYYLTVPASRTVSKFGYGMQAITPELASWLQGLFAGSGLPYPDDVTTVSLTVFTGSNASNIRNDAVKVLRVVFDRTPEVTETTSDDLYLFCSVTP